MNWIILVAIAIFADVLRVYLDNYITDVHFKGRYSIAQRFFYGIIYTITAILLLVIFSYNLHSTSPTTLFTFFASGLLTSLSGIPYYRALEQDDSTNLGIFFQFAPVLYLLANCIFFGVHMSLPQLVSIPVILAAPALVVLSTKKRNRHLRFKTMLLVLSSVLIEVIASLIFVNESSPNLNFFNEIAFVFLGHGLANIAGILLHPKWRKRYFEVVKKQKSKVVFPMLFASLINIVKITAYRFALILAPTVALASAASDAISPIAIFFAGIILTLIWPKFGREKLNKRSILVHLLATILIAIGIVLMQL